MKLMEMKDILGVDTISKKGKVITVRRGFFYTLGHSEQDVINRILKHFPHAKIIDSGEVWKQFKGGSSVTNQSHWFVKFTL